MFYCCFFFFSARSPRSVGQSLRNFATWSEACSIYKCRSKNLGVCPPKIGGGEKHAKFCLISDTFPLWAQISRERIEISKIWKPGARQHSLPRSRKKVRWTLVQMYPENRLFRNIIFWGCCAPKFLHAPQNGQVLLAHTPQRMGVPPTVFSMGGQKLA